MTSYLEEKLKSIEQNKMDLEKEQLKIQKQLELEIEKVRILELDGTIDKLKVQVNELSENINGNIMPNNIKLVYDQMTIDYRKESSEFHQLLQNGKLDANELEIKRFVIKEQKLIIDQMKREIPSNSRAKETFITLEKFKNNLSKINGLKI